MIRKMSMDYKFADDADIVIASKLSLSQFKKYVTFVYYGNIKFIL